MNTRRRAEQCLLTVQSIREERRYFETRNFEIGAAIMGWPTKSTRRDRVIPTRMSAQEEDALDDLTTAAGYRHRADTIRAGLELLARSKGVRKTFETLQAARKGDA